MLFIDFEPLCQTLWAFFSNVGSFYDAHSPNMVMSHDPKCKFKTILVFLILHLISGKATKFPVEKLSTSEVITKKSHGGAGKHSPPPVSAFRVKTENVES